MEKEGRGGRKKAGVGGGEQGPWSEDMQLRLLPVSSLEVPRGLAALRGLSGEPRNAGRGDRGLRALMT